MAFHTIIYDKKDGIAYITLNRPQVLNVYNVQMRDDLYQALLAVRDDPEVQALIISGAGRCFSAGADLTEFGTAPSVVIAREVRWARDVWGLLKSLSQPTIAAVHSYTLGSGLEMALFCDLRIAAEGAVFGLPEVALGFIPAAGGTQTMPREIKRGWATELILTGARIDAWEARRIGLVNKVVPREQLMAEAEGMARTVMSRGPIAVRLAKEAVNKGLDMPLGEGLRLEASLAALARATADAREGIAAFVEKRPPQFRGA